MTIQVKGITACLWPASVVITFPLQCGKRPQVTPISVGHKVVGKNAVQFGHCPLSTLCWRYLQLRLHILGKPLSQLSWKPAKNRMGFAILVCDPLWCRHTVTYQHPKPCHGHSLVSGSLQEMNVQHLPSSESVMMLNGGPFTSSICLRALALQADISYITQYISAVI